MKLISNSASRIVLFLKHFLSICQFLCFDFVPFYIFLSQSVAVYPRLAWNLLCSACFFETSCICLPSTRIISMHHQAWFHIYCYVNNYSTNLSFLFTHCQIIVMVLYCLDLFCNVIVHSSIHSFFSL